jgi:hypothetical protein
MLSYGLNKLEGLDISNTWLLRWEVVCKGSKE